MGKISSYPKITELTSDHLLLVDGSSGTKTIKAGDLVTALKALDSSEGDTGDGGQNIYFSNHYLNYYQNRLTSHVRPLDNISNAKVGDLLIEKKSSNIYKCVVAGDKNTAKWQRIQCLADSMETKPCILFQGQYNMTANNSKNFNQLSYSHQGLDLWEYATYTDGSGSSYDLYHIPVEIIFTTKDRRTYRVAIELPYNDPWNGGLSIADAYHVSKNGTYYDTKQTDSVFSVYLSGATSYNNLGVYIYSYCWIEILEIIIPKRYVIYY